MQQRRRARRICGLAAALLLAAALAVLPGTPAHAHAALIGTTPASGSQLDAPPEEIRLRFSERITVAPDGVQLLTGDGGPVDTGPADVDPDAPTEAVLPVPADLAEDTYLVTFRVVSADSHPVSGALVFSVGVPVSPLADLDVDTNEPALTATFATARWAGYAGLALLTGALAVFVLCWPAGWHHPRARRLLLAGWVTSVGSAAAMLLLQGPYAGGRSLTGVADPELLLTTLDSDYGRYLVARLVLLAATGALLITPLARHHRLRRPAALALAVALPVTWIGTGHSNTGTLVDRLVDTAHLVAMTGWFGGLVLLAICLLPRAAAPPAAEVGPALRRFSLLATGSVATLVVTGVYIAWREVGSFGALAGTTYGRLLAFKLAAVGLLLWLGAISRSVVHRRYLPETQPGSYGAGWLSRSKRRAARVAQQAEERSRAQLRQSVRLEVGTAVAVLAVVAVLAATPPGVVVTAEAADRGATGPVLESAPLTGTGERGTVRVLVDPARPGENRVVISVWSPDGDLWDVPEVRAALSLPEQDLDELALTLTPIGPGEYEAAAAQLPAAGSWQLDVTVRTSEIDSSTARLEIPIR